MEGWVKTSCGPDVKRSQTVLPKNAALYLRPIWPNAGCSNVTIRTKQMNEWMNECMHEWMNGCMNDWIGEWMYEWMKMNERVNEWMNGFLVLTSTYLLPDSFAILTRARTMVPRPFVARHNSILRPWRSKIIITPPCTELSSDYEYGTFNHVP